MMSSAPIGQSQCGSDLSPRRAGGWALQTTPAICAQPMVDPEAGHTTKKGDIQLLLTGSALHSPHIISTNSTLSQQAETLLIGFVRWLRPAPSEMEPMYLLCWSGGGGAHAGQWDALDQAHHALDLLVRNPDMQQRQLAGHLEPAARRELVGRTVAGESTEHMCGRGRGGEGRGGIERGREGHLGIRASLSTMHLASWTAKSMGCRMC